MIDGNTKRRNVFVLFFCFAGGWRMPGRRPEQHLVVYDELRAYMYLDGLMLMLLLWGTCQ